MCSEWWKDSKFYKEYGVEYSISKDFFNLLRSQNALIYTVGRDENNEIISCYVGVKQPYLFNNKIMSAHEIVWCVKKEYRNFRTLVGLVDAIEKLMEDEKILIWNLNVSNELKYNNIGRYLEKRNYNFMDKVYSKMGDL